MKPTRLLDLETRAESEGSICITVPEHPGATMPIVQYYIVCCICETIMHNVDSEAYYNEAKEVKEYASRLCVERDEAAQIAVAFSDDGESYCEMLALWASAGICAANVLINRLPLLLKNAGIQGVCVATNQTAQYVRVYSRDHVRTVFQALYILFPGADIDEDASTGQITVHIGRRQGGAQ